MNHSVPNEDRIQINKYAWLIFSVIAANYFFVCFHRVSPAVLALLIKKEFGVGAAVLGWMSSSYFYTYALIQPLVGYLVDRWGPRRTITLFTVVAFIGSAAFGLAPNIWVASFARALIGLGVGGVYVPGMAVLARWFQAGHFATVNGLFLALGSMGGIVAAAPLAWLSREMGWRPTFQIISFVTLLLALAGWMVIRDRRPDKAPRKTWDKNRGAEDNVPVIMVAQPHFDIRQCVIIYWLLLAIGGTGLTFQGLWGYPFLVDVRGMGAIEAGNLMMLMPLGFVIGTPAIGRLSDWYGRRKPFLILTAGGFVVFWLLLVFAPRVPSKWTVGIMLFIIGALQGSAVNLCFTVVRLSIPAPMLGRVMGWLNTSSFIGAAVFQVLTGWFMDRVGRIGAGGFPPAAYRNAFMLLLAVSALSFIMVFALREPSDKHSQRTDA